MIIDFLKTNRDKKDLKIALEVLTEFKECESVEEWFVIDFAAWAKLEQLEEYLRHLVHGESLAEDTLKELERQKLAKSKEVSQ